MFRFAVLIVQSDDHYWDGFHLCLRDSQEEIKGGLKLGCLHQLICSLILWVQARFCPAKLTGIDTGGYPPLQLTFPPLFCC